MTAEERFERIESDLEAVSAKLKVLTESQISLGETLSRFMKATDESHQRLSVLISDLAHSMSLFDQRLDQQMAAADARMRRVEENLDGLIRAITAEHSNGKGKQ